MGNTIDIIRPSYLGIPQCINETVSISNDLAQCVGTDARWPSAVRRSMTVEVAGECYKTDTALPDVVNMIKHGQLMQAKLTAEEVTADRLGRAVTQYRYRLTLIASDIPHRDKIECLYVPRWQQSHDVLQDYSGHGRNMALSNVQFSDIAVILESNSRGYTGEIGDYGNNLTVLADRDVSARTSGRGFMLSTKGGGISLTIEERSSSGYIIRNLGENNSINLCSDGWVHYRRNDYCGQALTAGSKTTQGCRISFSGTSGVPTWQRCRALAMWSIALSDEEIDTAIKYLIHAPIPTDI